jgi:uncharacterized protein YdaU (DUF1376 family)
MARKSPAFSFYPDSWFLGTSNLSAAQEGIYIRLLCLQWSNGAFSVEQAFDHSKRSASETDIMTVLQAKFKLLNGLYLNERLENERSLQQVRAENAKKAGKKSGEQRSKNKNKATANERLLNGTGNETATTTATQSPTENEHSDSDSVSDSVLNTDSESGSERGDSPLHFLPEEFHTTEFLQLWDKRRQKHVEFEGRPLSEVQAREELMEFRRRGYENSIKDLKTTILKGYGRIITEHDKFQPTPGKLATIKDPIFK